MKSVFISNVIFYDSDNKKSFQSNRFRFMKVDNHSIEDLNKIVGQENVVVK